MVNKLRPLLDETQKTLKRLLSKGDLSRAKQCAKDLSDTTERQHTAQDTDLNTLRSMVEEGTESVKQATQASLAEIQQSVESMKAGVGNVYDKHKRKLNERLSSLEETAAGFPEHVKSCRQATLECGRVLTSCCDAETTVFTALVNVLSAKETAATSLQQAQAIRNKLFTMTVDGNTAAGDGQRSAAGDPSPPQAPPDDTGMS